MLWSVCDLFFSGDDDDELAFGRGGGEVRDEFLQCAVQCLLVQFADFAAH